MKGNKQQTIPGFSKRGRPRKKKVTKAAVVKKLNGSGPKGTYVRKYFLHRQIKKAGFTLELEHTTKNISVPHNLVNEAYENKYVLELQQHYNYGVQTSIV